MRRRWLTGNVLIANTKIIIDFAVKEGSKVTGLGGKIWGKLNRGRGKSGEVERKMRGMAGGVGIKIG